MAIYIDWGQKVIHIAKADMQLVQSNPVEIRQLDIDALRLILKDLEDGSDGMVFESTHEHVAPISVGGVGLARVVQFINGYTVTFEDGQYAVNLTGGNTNLGDLVNVNQVSVRSSNSAGLVNLESMKLQAFADSRVWINTTLGLPGVIFPRGTPSKTSDNPTDARAIATTNSLDRFHIIGLITLPNGENFMESDWLGSSSNISEIDLNNVDVNGSTFSRAKINGACNGKIRVSNCDVSGITNFKGSIYESDISGDIVVKSTNTDKISLVKCVSSVPGSSTPCLDLNNANCDAQVRDYFGGIKIANYSQGNNMSIDMSSGTVVIDSTCTAGLIVVRGIGELEDNSGNGCTVISTALISPTQASGDVNVIEIGGVPVSGPDDLKSPIPSMEFS